MRRNLATLMVYVFAASALATAALARPLSATHDTRAHAQAKAAARRYLAGQVVRSAATVRYWQRLMHRPLIHTNARRLQGAGGLRELAQHAKRLRHQARELAAIGQRPPHLADWLCIQRHETAPPYPGWRTASGNTYYGGLQMDRNFQQQYAPWLYEHKGTADHWSALEQI